MQKGRSYTAIPEDTFDADLKRLKIYTDNVIKRFKVFPANLKRCFIFVIRDLILLENSLRSPMNRIAKFP